MKKVWLRPNDSTFQLRRPWPHRNQVLELFERNTNLVTLELARTKDAEPFATYMRVDGAVVWYAAGGHCETCERLEPAPAYEARGPQRDELLEDDWSAFLNEVDALWALDDARKAHRKALAKWREAHPQ